MRRLRRSIVQFLSAEEGPTAVEYAVMLAMIIVVCLATISTLGSNTNNSFSYTANVVGKTAS
jgi:pilus assembly protein Flp/PilA